MIPLASTHIRTEKLLKELGVLFTQRQDNFEDLKFFALTGNKENVKYCYGKAVALRRSIFNLLIAFSLTDNDLYRENDERFELDYLVQWEEELSELNE